ncbi:MAG: dTDP-4-dehydrorhamnose reductase [Arcobacteraceae bacterium]|jgi:dTDP-4-dehydrorhamnose reductase|nr:dTDP-4-dehydrorhamnose reductase [Arcobacteraceae bacterium]
MHKNSSSYDQWNDKKKFLNNDEVNFRFNEQDIFFMYLGNNIGFEQDGGKDFLRPVLVYKKFNNRVFLGIPLTSKAKNNQFHFEFAYKKDIKSYAILSQLKLFDIKRANFRDGKISKKDFFELQDKLLSLIVTPLEDQRVRTKAICDEIISKEFSNVNILVTGSNGQVGSEIKELSSNYPYNFFFTTSKDLDITDHHTVEAFCKENNINTIINCAAYTAVDKAESDEVTADLVNRKAVKKLAKISLLNNIKLIHISTDYVFDGKAYKPYCEEFQTNPQSVYGATKLAGENEMLTINPANSIIIRTSWVYSYYGANFVKTMLRLGKEKESLGVIFDQVGTPTYAKDLAKVILDIIPQINNQKVEIYNYSNEGVLSWYDFAKEIMKMAKLPCQINPIETFQYPTPAKRPHYSLLNKNKIKSTFNIEIPYWKDGLDDCLKRLGERK